MNIRAIIRIYGKSVKPNEFVYTTLCSRLKVRPKTILIESFHGRLLMGNIAALLNTLVTDERFGQYQIFIAVKNEIYNEQKNEYSSYSNVKVIRFQSLQYICYLATSQYLINDTTFFPYFSKKPDQIYLNTWHGTPFKCMGFDEPDVSAWKLGNTVRNFIHCDYLLMPNEYTKKLFDRAYRLPGVFNGKVLLGGYPGNDSLVQNKSNSNVVDKIRRDLGVPDGKKIVMYAPTWRGKIGQPVSTEHFDRDTLSKLLELQDDFILLYRGHPINDSESTLNGRVIDVSRHKDINDLYLCADILITDYSSLFVDYSILGKPVIFYMYDKELYRKERGFYQEMYDQLPGPVCRNFAELSTALPKLLKTSKNKVLDNVETFKEKFCSFNNGTAAKDIIGQVFFNEERLQSIQYNTSCPEKKRLLMFMGGWFTNGVTVSALNLLNSLDYTKYSVDLLMRPTAFDYPHNIRQIPDQVNMISISGNMSLELLFQYVLQYLNIPGVARLNPLKSYNKEIKRLLGSNKYDTVVNFCGYSPYFTSLLASVKHCKKILYLHSNLKKEQQIRFPRLRITMSLLHRYDALAPVSESLGQVIALDFPDEKHKLHVCENLIGLKKVLSWVREPAEIIVDKRCYNFITIGRYSPEKGHERLLDAFKTVSERHKNARLYIVASHGPLKNATTAQIKKLGLQEKVILTGPLTNPFPLLQQCDCFVLSSLYEGQGLVLLEAMALGVPVISTDIEGAKSVVDGNGLLIESSTKGLAEGLEQALECGLQKTDFDSEAYDRKAVGQFYEILER